MAEDEQDDELDEETAPTEGGDDDFSVWDEYQEMFGEPKPIRKTLQDDGLPGWSTPKQDDAHAPSLTEDTFVCIADLRKFVVRDRAWGAVVAEFESDQAVRTSNGRYRVPLGVAVDRYARRLPIAGSVSRMLSAALLRRHTVVGYDDGSWWAEVEPVRPQCKHLLQQLDPPSMFDTQLEIGSLRRYCTLRRSTTGAMLGLTNEAIGACTMREPYHSSVERITLFDEVKTEQGRNREYYSMFAEGEPRDKDVSKPKLGIFE